MKKVIESVTLFFIGLCYRFLNYSLYIFGSLLFHKKIPKNIKRILVLRIGDIGDTICAVPAMVQIKANFPAAKITLLTATSGYGKIGANELVRGAEFLDKLIIYSKEEIRTLKGKHDLFRRVKNEKADLFIELPQDLTKFSAEIRNLIFAKLIGAKYAFGFTVSTLRIFKKLQSRHLTFDTEVRRLLKILKREKLKIDEARFPLPISEIDQIAVNRFLAQTDKNRLVAINPGAKSERNIWPLERFAAVGRYLAGKRDISIMIIGGSKERESAEKLKNAIGEKSVNAAGKLEPLQTIELLKRCELLISNDTSAIHMAAAVGTPIIGIYAAWQLKGKWFPSSPENIILRKEPVCHTCYAEYCGNKTCLNMIKTEEVCDAADGFLSRKLIKNVIEAKSRC